MKRYRNDFHVSFSECDPAAIVFYPSIFLWFERGTEALFRSVGLPWTEMFPDNGLAGIPLLDASASFSKPMRMGDLVTLETWIDEWRNRTFVVKHRLSVDGEITAQAQEIRAWAKRDPSAPEGAKAVPVPDEIKARFE